MANEKLINKNNSNQGEAEFSKESLAFLTNVINNAPNIKQRINSVDFNPLMIPLRNFILETLDSEVACVSLLIKGYSAQACIILRTFMLSVAKLVFMAFNGSTILNWTNHDNIMQDEVEERKKLDFFKSSCNKKYFHRRNLFCDFGWAYSDTVKPIYTKYNLYSYVGFDQFGEEFHAEINLIAHNDICLKNKYDSDDDKFTDFLNKNVRIIAVLHNFLLRSICKLKITNNKILHNASYQSSMKLVPGLDEWWDTKIYDKRVKVETPESFK